MPFIKGTFSQVSKSSYFSQVFDTICKFYQTVVYLQQRNNISLFVHQQWNLIKNRTSWSTSQLTDYHVVHLCLQQNQQSHPETVLSRWNLGVGSKCLRQNKLHSTSLLHQLKHKSSRNSMALLANSSNHLCTVYWKIPVWVPADFSLMFYVFRIFKQSKKLTQPEAPPFFLAECMDLSPCIATQWWKPHGFQRHLYHPSPSSL